MTPLPPHLQAVAAAVGAPLSDPLSGADVAAPIGRLGEAIGRESARLPAGSTVSIDAFSLMRALECPASRSVDVEQPPFEWSPGTSARWLGMHAVEAFVTGQCRDVASAVSAACAGLGSDGREAEGKLWGPPAWLRDAAAPGVRAATVAAATQWAEQAAQWVPWAMWRGKSHRLRFDPSRGAWPRRSAAITIKPRWDADLRPFTDKRSRVQILLLSAGVNSPSADASIRMAALGGWLDEPRAGHGPERVVAVHPSSGDVAPVDVSRDLLDAAVDEIVRVTPVLVDAALSHPLAATPGPSCRWCPRSTACDVGTAWLSRPDRRVAGLPVG